MGEYGMTAAGWTKYACAGLLAALGSSSFLETPLDHMRRRRPKIGEFELGGLA